MEITQAEVPKSVGEVPGGPHHKTTQQIHYPGRVALHQRGDGTPTRVSTVASAVQRVPGRGPEVLDQVGGGKEERGLLAFADDMLIITNNQNELVMIIEELTALQRRWNLRLNKKKSKILTKEEVQEVGCIKCTKTVKY